jgi:hypothetical protein
VASLRHEKRLLLDELCSARQRGDRLQEQLATSARWTVQLIDCFSRQQQPEQQQGQWQEQQQGQEQRQEQKQGHGREEEGDQLLAEGQEQQRRRQQQAQEEGPVSVLASIYSNKSFQFT